MTATDLVRQLCVPYAVIVVAILFAGLALLTWRMPAEISLSGEEQRA